MESIDLKRLNLTIDESRDIINFIAQKRGISTEKLLSTIKPNLKHNNNEILTTKTQQNMVKTQQNMAKTQQNMAKTQQNMAKTQQKLRKSQQNIAKTQQKLIKSQITQQKLIKSQQELIKSPKKQKVRQKLRKSKQKLIKSQQELMKLGKRKNTQNLTYKKPSKLAKRENLISQKQQFMSKNKKTIEIAREKLKELRHKFSKSDLKTVKRHLYKIENKKRLLELEITNEYFDELDKKFLEFDEYYNDNDNDDDFIGIENVQDLFKISIYKSTIVKSGYNYNYIEYRIEGDKLLTIEEYLNLIEPYLRELINNHKSKGESKIQLTAQINFISLRPGSDETRVIHTRTANEEFMNGSDTDEIIKELFRSLLQRY